MTDESVTSRPVETSTAPADRLPLRSVRNRLAVLWLVGTALFGGLLIAQSLLGKYEGRAQEVWSWALPTVLPALSLVLSVLGYDALREKGSGLTVDRTFFRITRALSIGYIFLVVLPVLIEPFTPYRPLELLKLANLWLAPMQGLVVSALGVLFFKTEKEEGAEGG